MEEYSVLLIKNNLPYLIPSLFKKINQSKHTINLKDLNHDRDFCHIDDLCRAVNILKKKIQPVYLILELAKQQIYLEL